VQFPKEYIQFWKSGNRQKITKIICLQCVKKRTAGDAYPPSDSSKEKKYDDLQNAE
jgi:hypothetical protein